MQDVPTAPAPGPDIRYLLAADPLSAYTPVPAPFMSQPPGKSRHVRSPQPSVGSRVDSHVLANISLRELLSSWKGGSVMRICDCLDSQKAGCRLRVQMAPTGPLLHG